MERVAMRCTAASCTALCRRPPALRLRAGRDLASRHLIRAPVLRSQT